jgi:hypothetical protein
LSRQRAINADTLWPGMHWWLPNITLVSLQLPWVQDLYISEWWGHRIRLLRRSTNTIVVSVRGAVFDVPFMAVLIAPALMTRGSHLPGVTSPS